MPERDPGEPQLVLLGPPGSGKGTQGVRLAERLGVAHISSGDLLRASVQAGDPHGVAALITAGSLVPDETLHAVLLEQLPAGFVLDGYPRSAAQARALDDAIGPRTLDRVIEIEVPDDVLLPRLLARATSQHRPDDVPETIAARLDVYRAEIAALREHYGDRLARVDGVGPHDEVFERLVAACT